jgi:Predicted oxidoreductases of the aldo/keto reductase family
MEPVKGGTLAKIPEEAEKLLNSLNPEMSVPSWAIRFAASKENVFMVLSGMSNMEQLIDNTSYMKDFVPLSDAEEKAVFNVADIINRKIAIPCTGCSYCTVNCPKNISIPKFFSLYNTEMLEDSSKNWTPQGGYYERLTIDFGKASDCVGCGQCEGMCPQHLPIRKYLKMVAEKFE